MQVLKLFLIPIAGLYGLITFVRNKLYDFGIFKTIEYPNSLITVGNLSAGGTGKTPMVEYLIELLQKNYTLATLSRGYKRKTSGFFLADSNSTALEIGDEPLQYVKKFPSLVVAVDANRRRGIELLKENSKALQVILLDDAFQHRSIKASLSILLTDFSNLFFDDQMLPLGSLREYKSGVKRADIIVVTKTPVSLTPIEKRIILKKIQVLDYQQVYFSFIKYGELISVNPEHLIPQNKKQISILLLCGIANPMPLEEQLKLEYKEVIPSYFSDHYDFKEEDLKAVTAAFDKIAATNKIIITTEKDWMRLQKSELQEWVKKLPLFYIPIKTDFNEKDKQEFNAQIINYVRTN
jgi:tetraacyldisaccharide 4'-kinase